MAEVPKPKRILIVEDEALIALDVHDMLQEAGYGVAGTAERIEKALAMIANEAIDAAVLDVNLDGEKIWPVAYALRDRNIPFVFLTGSSAQLEPHQDFEKVLRLGKPVNADALFKAVAAMVEADLSHNPP